MVMHRQAGEPPYSGTLGLSQPMPVFPFTAFSVRDDDLVIVESIAGEQYIRPRTD